MISAIFDYLLSTPTLGMPFRTWFQTLLPIALISGISEYLMLTTLCNAGTASKPVQLVEGASQTIFSSSLEPATNERPEKFVNTELCPLLNKGLSSVVDNYSTQPFPYYELYNVIQMVEITILLGLHLCIMVMIRVTLMSFCNTGKAVKSGQLVEFLCNAGKASKPGQLVEYLCNTGKMSQFGQLVESTDVLDVRGALVALSHMSIFKVQTHYHLLSSGGRRGPFRKLFILPESDHLGDPYQLVKLEVLYWFASWICTMIGELLYRVPRNTIVTETFESKMLKYEVCLCAVIITFSQESSKSVSQGQFAIHSASYSTVWIVLGVLILAALANVDPPRIEARKVSISGKDCGEIILAAQLTAIGIHVRTFMCALSWLWWSFRFCQCEYIIWAIIASGDIIIFTVESSNDGPFL